MWKAISTYTCTLCFDGKEIIRQLSFWHRFPFHLHHLLLKSMIATHAQAQFSLEYVCDLKIFGTIHIFHMYSVACAAAGILINTSEYWRTSPIYSLSHQFHLCIDTRLWNVCMLDFEFDYVVCVCVCVV